MQKKQFREAGSTGLGKQMFDLAKYDIKPAILLDWEVGPITAFRSLGTWERPQALNTIVKRGKTQ